MAETDDDGEHKSIKIGDLIDILQRYDRDAEVLAWWDGMAWDIHGITAHQRDGGITLDCSSMGPADGAEDVEYVYLTDAAKATLAERRAWRELYG